LVYDFDGFISGSEAEILQHGRRYERKDSSVLPCQTS